MKNLTDKVILITGGSSGMGEQMAYEAAKRGAVVVVSARRAELLADVVERCQILSGKQAYGFPCDVSDPDSCDELIEKVDRTVGAVDVLANVAGFGIFENYLDIDFKDVRSMFAVNVLGLMYLTQHYAAKMVTRGHGQIVNFSSQAGKIATPKSSVYSATKFAIVGFSNALRLELKPFGVQVLTICPGPITTSFFSKADPSGDYIEKVKQFALEPEALAKKIVDAFLTNKREINAPWYMEAAGRFYVLFPHVGDVLAGSIFNQK